MTRIAFTPPPASTPTRTPAGHTEAALTHGTKAQSSCRDQFDASTSVLVTKCASEATPLPRRMKGPHTIPQAYERLNRPQMRADRRSDWADALPPVWVLLISAGACLFALLVADTIYTAFIDWMVTR